MDHPLKRRGNNAGARRYVSVPTDDEAAAIIFAYRRAMEAQGASIERLRVLAVVLDHIDWRLGYSWPDYQRIAEHAGVSLSTVETALTWLVKKGIIVRIGMKVPGIPYRRATYRPAPMPEAMAEKEPAEKVSLFIRRTF